MDEREPFQYESEQPPVRFFAPSLSRMARLLTAVANPASGEHERAVAEAAELPWGTLSTDWRQTIESAFGLTGKEPLGLEGLAPQNQRRQEAIRNILIGGVGVLAGDVTPKERGKVIRLSNEERMQEARALAAERDRKFGPIRPRHRQP